MTDRDPAPLPEVLARGDDGVLLLGIGGGGDVVGALTIARGLEAAGRRVEVGGVAWERFAIDPHHAGPRPLGHLGGIERLGGGAALTGADGSTPEGVRLAEAGVAAHLGRSVALVDVNDGPAAVADADRHARRPAPSATWSSSSTSAATCSRPARSRGSRARSATR